MDTQDVTSVAVVSKFQVSLFLLRSSVPGKELFL